MDSRDGSVRIPADEIGSQGAIPAKSQPRIRNRTSRQVAAEQPGKVLRSR